MAFVDRDSYDDFFVNVSHRVGKSGDWDDVYIVQAMLEFIYTTNPKLRKSKPTKGPITVTGKPAEDTSVLIAHFQKMYMKRAKPQGYLDQAIGKTKENATIWQLNQHMTAVLLAVRSPENVISYLKRKAPLLGPSLRTREERHLEYSY